jgi:hypothetical protein
MKRIIVVGVLFLVLGCQLVYAAVPEIIGGIRDGLAVGLQLEAAVARNLTLRGGVEFDTGKQPVIAFLGGKFPLTSIGRMPLSLGLGFVGYFGDRHTDPGFSLTFIFNRFLDLQPLFLEVGVDVAEHGRLVAQLGYKIY